MLNIWLARENKRHGPEQGPLSVVWLLWVEAPNAPSLDTEGKTRTGADAVSLHRTLQRKTEITPRASMAANVGGKKVSVEF